MPKYKADIKYIIREKDLRKMLDACKNIRDKALLCILWLTGARPGEILQLKRKDVVIEDLKIKFMIKTLKHKKGKFSVDYREIIYNRPFPRDDIIEIVVKYVSSVQDPEQLLFRMSDRNIEYIVEHASVKALGIRLAPYNFRHSRFTLLMEAGYPPHFVKYVKGAQSLASIEPYLHAKPIVIKILDPKEQTL